MASPLPRLRIPRLRFDAWIAGLLVLVLVAPIVVGCALYALAVLSLTRPADLRDVRDVSDVESYERDGAGADLEDWPGAPCCWDVR